jgi:hypothetical protein
VALDIEAKIRQSRLIGGAAHKRYNDLEVPRYVYCLCILGHFGDELLWRM